MADHPRWAALTVTRPPGDWIGDTVREATDSVHHAEGGNRVIVRERVDVIDDPVRWDPAVVIGEEDYLAACLRGTEVAGACRADACIVEDRGVDPQPCHYVGGPALALLDDDQLGVPGPVDRARDPGEDLGELFRAVAGADDDARACGRRRVFPLGGSGRR
jgi:hypothetical protein